MRLQEKIENQLQQTMLVIMNKESHDILGDLNQLAFDIEKIAIQDISLVLSNSEEEQEEYFKKIHKEV